MAPEVTKFCPECEREYPGVRQECPDDGAPLMTYEVVDATGGDDLVGAVLDDRFRVDEPISEGGMGKVYRGTQTRVGREVAIKVLSSDLDREETQMRRFLREARTLSQLSHPNIVNFIDSGQDPRYEAVYLVMELIEGDDLSELVKDDRIDPALLTEIGIQVCSALAEPHDAGMIHRDLKPANLMLTSRVDGALQTKIVDFGITNVVHDETRLTKQGNVCGTPHYMAPEQVEGGAMTPAADIYALGAIFFHLLTGTVVFEGKSDIQVLFGHVQKPAPSPSRIADAPEVPGALGRLVGGMLAKSPGDRPGSALVVRDELEAIRREHGFPTIRIESDLPLQRAIDQWIYRADTASRSLDRPVTGEAASRPETGAERVAGSAPSTDPSAQSLRVSEQVDGASAREGTAQIAVDSGPVQTGSKRDREAPSVSGSGPAQSGPKPDRDTREGPSISEMLDEGAVETDDRAIEPWLYIMITVLVGLGSATGGVIWALTGTESRGGETTSPSTLGAGEPTGEPEAAPPMETTGEPAAGTTSSETQENEGRTETTATETPTDETAKPREHREQRQQPGETEGRQTASSDQAREEEHEGDEPETTRRERSREGPGGAEKPADRDEGPREGAAGTDDEDGSEKPSGTTGNGASDPSAGNESGDQSSGDEGFQPVNPSSPSGQDGEKSAPSDEGSGSGDSEESSFEPVVD